MLLQPIRSYGFVFKISDANPNKLINHIISFQHTGPDAFNTAISDLPDASSCIPLLKVQFVGRQTRWDILQNSPTVKSLLLIRHQITPLRPATTLYDVILASDDIGTYKFTDSNKATETLAALFRKIVNYELTVQMRAFKDRTHTAIFENMRNLSIAHPISDDVIHMLHQHFMSQADIISDLRNPNPSAPHWLTTTILAATNDRCQSINLFQLRIYAKFNDLLIIKWKKIIAGTNITKFTVKTKICGSTLFIMLLVL